ncbi:hypothetical protein K3495_g8134 [Podosphaera aphanis]|nr:hypothetical protein K3495_g8134 [Podosphaera aphanis]
MNSTRQTRASRPKVKTGCNNCKLRRIKCDETRPQCLKCVKANRQCGGYPVSKRPADLALPPIAPAPSPRNNSNIGLTYSSHSIIPQRSRIPVTQDRSYQARNMALPPEESVIFYPSLLTAQVGGSSFDQLESQYFQVFRTHTANELSGFFDSDFWTHSVLIESHSEAYVRHAVIALGALYKTLDNAVESRRNNSPGSSTRIVNHYTYALQQYGKAIRRLRESLATKNLQAHRTMLISIIIFICIQSFTGDHSDAIGHIQTGLKLLEEWGPSSHEPELVQIFTRLSIQAKSYDMAFHLPNSIKLSSCNESSLSTEQVFPIPPMSETNLKFAEEIVYIPERFFSATEARPALDYLTQSILRLLEKLSSQNPGPNNILPISLQNYCHQFRVQLEKWGAAYLPVVENARGDSNISYTERAGIYVLRMFFNMTYILYFMTFSETEMGFDDFTSEFNEIIDLANEISMQDPGSYQEQGINSLQSPINNFGNKDKNCNTKASFALELGIVPPLYVVATKCRNRKLRREAIRLLLSAPRREGMWDSLLCGHLAQWIMGIEEEDLPPWDDNLSPMQVPACNKRVMVKGVFFNLQKQEATITCGHRAIGNGDKDNRVRRTYICW